MPTLRERIGGAFRGFQGRQDTPGEVALADPFRLFPGKNATLATYNPSSLVTRKGLRVFDDMRRDEQVKAAMAFKKGAVIATGWEVVSPQDEEADWEPTEFVQESLSQLSGTVDSALLEIMTALDFGYSITEKIWELDGPRVRLTALKTKRPHSFQFHQDEFGSVIGISQEGGSDNLPIEKFILLAYDGEFGNPYGCSDLEAAYRAWWTKGNAYRYLAMMLERFGIPPIFAMYNPDKYKGKSLDDFKTILKNLQAATSGLVPRSTPDDLEMWTPEIGGQVSSVFIPALDRFDTDISKAILMPGLLGISPEESTGSQARARVIFDVFMFVIESIRRTMQETVMQEQVVKPLVDLNFNVTDYPQFRLLPINDDTRLDLFDAWSKMLELGAVTPQDSDEDHIRSALQFPEKDESDDREIIDRDDPDNGDDGAPDPDDDSVSDFALSRAPKDFERKVDFAAIERSLRASEESAIAALLEPLKAAQARITRRVRKQRELSVGFVNSVSSVFGNKSFQTALVSQLQGTATLGRSQIRQELPRKFEQPAFVPADAMRFLRERGLLQSKTVEERLVKDVRAALMKSLELGEGTAQAADRVARVFDAFIVAAGTEAVPNSLLLENIVRTETTTAFNFGRLLEMRQDEDLIQGVEYSAILDTRTTDVCSFLDGKIFKLSDPKLDQLKPPNHFICRSLLVPITIADDEVQESEFIQPSQAGKGAELALKGFV